MFTYFKGASINRGGSEGGGEFDPEREVSPYECENSSVHPPPPPPPPP